MDVRFPTPVTFAFSAALGFGDPEVPITRADGGKTWRCDAGKHKYHRNESAARWCAWQSIPRTVSWRPISEYR